MSNENETPDDKPGTDEKDVQEADTETVNGEDTKAGVKSTGAPEDDADAAQTDAQAVEGANVTPGVEVPADGLSGIAAGNPAAWSADQYGNPTVQTTPARPLIAGRQFYPFEYEANDNGTITATETVYMAFYYPGSDRVGRSLAYPAGAILREEILEAVEESLTTPGK